MDKAEKKLRVRIDPVHMRVSVNVQTNIPVKGRLLHRIAAYKLSDIPTMMSITSQGYDFENPKLVSRKTKDPDPVLDNGDVITVYVKRRTD